VFANAAVQTQHIDLGDVARSESPSAVFRKTVGFTGPKGAKLKSVRVKLANPGILPSWHPGAGGETFVFVDELTVNTVR